MRIPWTAVDAGIAVAVDRRRSLMLAARLRRVSRDLATRRSAHGRARERGSRATR